MAHTMMEHRSGLIVDVECTEFTGGPKWRRRG
jgi:hypothetical protein